MQNLSQQILFKIEDIAFSRYDIIVAAILWAEWSDFVQAINNKLACFKKATLENTLPARELVESAIREFRYSHNLITADETMAWLNKWQLATEEWFDYFRRNLLAQQPPIALRQALEEHPVCAADFFKILEVEWICNGQLLQWTEKLAGRAALMQKLFSENPEAKVIISRDTAQKIAPISNAPYAELATTENNALIAQIEATYRYYVDSAIPEQTIAELIRSHTIHWTLFNYQYLLFDSEAKAREAGLCLTNDGLELAEIARLTKTELIQDMVFLENLDPEVQQLFLAAHIGQTLFPVNWHKQFALIHIQNRITPTPEHPRVQKRARKQVIDTVIKQELNKRVTWHIDLEKQIG